MADSAQTIDPEAAQRAIEYCYEQGWTDGLPIIPPTEELVQQCVAASGREPDEVLSHAEHLDADCTVWQAAINAVMAGCRPEYFPVVVAAVANMWGDPDRGFPGVMSSTSGYAPCVVVNGPIRQEVQLNCTGSLLNPGFRANAAIGRTLHLIAMNVFEVKPHVLEQATQGTSSKYSFCFGENEEESPWEPLHVERGFPCDTSTVTTFLSPGCMPVDIRHTQDPERLLLSMAYMMSATRTAYEDSWVGLIMGPEHAHLLARAGWDKKRVEHFLWDHYGQKLGDLKAQGQGDFEEDMRAERAGHYVLVEAAHPERRMPGADDLSDDTFIHAARDPESIFLVVAGANNAGVSTVISIGNALGMPQNGWPRTQAI